MVREHVLIDPIHPAGVGTQTANTEIHRFVHASTPESKNVLGTLSSVFIYQSVESDRAFCERIKAAEHVDGKINGFDRLSGSRGSAKMSKLAD